MKVQEIVKEFGVTEKTVYNWKNSDNKRKLLYETLKALPVEFVESVKEEIQEQENKDKKLREALGLE